MKSRLAIAVRTGLLTLFMGLLVSASFAQKKVTGKVSGGDTGGGLSGATVKVKGSSTATTTGADGSYAITVPNNGTLEVSFVGYETQDVKVGAGSVVNVVLQASSAALQTVVVTGYGTQEKRSITGSVAVVDTKEMTKFAASNIADQLQGKVPGVQMSTSGDPGAAAFVRIRGIGTINNNEPLYVIDGVPVQNESNINFLNPNDIESIQVLKDAASASIYGSRAANGVIVITTKKGKSGTSKLNVDVFYGSQSPSKIPETLSPTEFLEVQQKLAAGQGIPFTSNIYINQGGKWVLPDYAVRGLGGFLAGNPAVDPAKYNLNLDPTGGGVGDYLILQTNKAGTNWFKEVFQPAVQKSYQISASGGSDKGQYFFSGNVYDHNGIMLGNSYKRYQVRVNSTYNIGKNIRVGENLNIAYQTTRASFGNPNEGSPLIGTYGMPQLVPVYDIKGNFASPANFNSNVSNPVADLSRNRDNSQGHSFRVTGSAFAEIDLTDFLTWKSSYGLDYNSGPGQYYGTRRYDATEGNTNPNSLQNTYFLNRNWVAFSTLSFKKNFGDHRVTALAGYEAKQTYYEGFNAGGSQLAFDNFNYRLLQNVNPATFYMSSYRGEHNVVSQFVQAAYSLSDKYLFSGTVRRDGSSRFIENKYGIFPSASAGWRISKEKFMDNVKFINDLKLRASYGILGNNEVGGDYPGFSNFATSLGTANYSINGSASSNTVGFEQVSTGNPKLKWETSAVTNIGFDASLAGGWNVMLEWYKRQTRDMIYNVELPLELGAVGRQAQNIGEMTNTGLDFSVGYTKRVNRDFSFNASFTGSTVKNEVVKLEANSNTFIRSGGTRIGDVTYTKAGLPISQLYGYIQEGLWKSDADIAKVLFADRGDAKVGRFRYKDLNGDGKIDNNDETFLGSPLPKLILGLNLTANYKNWDFTAYLSGNYGQKLFNFVKYFTHFNAFQRSRSKDFLYEAGKTLPVLDGGDNYSSQRNSYYVEDGSFTRLRNLQVGYSLNAANLKKLGLSKARFYVQGQNLLTFTKYSGLDPDVTITNITEGYNSQRDLSIGLDNGRYPLARSIIVGVNLEF
ncbi:MAG: TonB-dependent receptor [Chitinophagia bacterium]|nr:TonB-dependent receptor [Chitinophagia bacterium]